MAPESIITSENIPQEAFDYYDQYAHGDITRRTFIARLASLSVAGLSISTIANALLPNYAKAEQISFNDADIKASYVSFESPKGHGVGRGYLVLPSVLNDKAPSVLVAHENRGLNPYIEDVTRRLAKAGYIAFAPDALHTLGGYPGNDDDGREMQKQLDRTKIAEDFAAAALWLKGNEQSSGKLGAVGFCFGGFICNYLAAIMPMQLSAAVPYYGTPASDNLQAKVTGPLLLHFAEDDARVNATWDAYEAVLQATKADYTMHFYPNTHHGFHNDSTSRYSDKDAELSWQRTLAFLGQHLR